MNFALRLNINKYSKEFWFLGQESALLQKICSSDLLNYLGRPSRQNFQEFIPQYGAKPPICIHPDGSLPITFLSD
jgi:hypothetical protein